MVQKLEAGRRKLMEMMENGGRRIRKVRRTKKSKVDTPKVGTQGTLANYFINNMVGGTVTKLNGGVKRKVEAMDDGTDGMVLDSKRLRKFKNLKPTDEGAKSKSKTDPSIAQLWKELLEKRPQIPRDL